LVGKEVRLGVKTGLLGFGLRQQFGGARSKREQLSDLEGQRISSSLIRDQVELIGSNATVIIDIGAHTGESSLEYLTNFPHARVFAFEPDATALEVEFKPIYKDQPLFLDVCAYLYGFGYSFFKLYDPVYHASNKNVLCWADAIFLAPELTRFAGGSKPAHTNECSLFAI
jgi:hypothetical protein